VRSHLQAAGVKLVDGGRNQTLTDEERWLDRPNERQRPERSGRRPRREERRRRPKGQGTLSGIDSLMLPTLERWRYQLPLTVNVDILDGWEKIRKWFGAMESFRPYWDFAAGDMYSWTALSSTFLRYVGRGEEKPDVAAGIQNADNSAKDLAE
jgi:hypothetical protein